MTNSVSSDAILVTGGAGYIGSHACVELLQAGYRVVVLDNLCNSDDGAPGRIGKIAGREPLLVRADIRDEAALDKVFTEHAFGAVLHFAGLKSPAESIARPLEYYDNNVHGSVALFDAMGRHGVKTLVFSSSAAVYGVSAALPVREDAPLAAIHPYGRSKAMVEEILRDLVAADPQWRVALLRYFNPVGAHESGLIGENPAGIPNNLMPYVAQVAAGLRPELSVFGDDYPTPDGTGIRDYIHVTDLARGHIAALDWLRRHGGLDVFNLGTGSGKSVLEVVRAFEFASGRPVPYRIMERRPGDAAQSYADPSRAEKELGWKARLGLEEMCRDAWNWQAKHLS